MADFGLTPEGYRAPRANDLLLQIRQAVEAELGVTIDWDAASVLTALTNSIALALGTVAQQGQAVYDAFNPSNAQGAFLDAIGAIRGVERRAATYSSATVTLTGTAGVIVPSGSLVSGGGDDGQARWRIGSNVTLTGGSADVVVTATVAGPIAAASGAIDTIVTPVAGWTACTNAAAAVTGDALETDAAYRVRQVVELQRGGDLSPAAIRARLLALTDGGVAVVQSCVVLDNPRATVRIIGGLTFPPHSFAPVIWPPTLTDAQIVQVATAIYQSAPVAGCWSAGPATTDASGVATTVTGADGFPHPIRWYWAVATPIPVALALTLAAGYDLADVHDDVQAAVQALVDALAVGATLYTLDVQQAALAVNPAAIRGIVVTLDGVTADYAPAITEIVQVDGSVVVTA